MKNPVERLAEKLLKDSKKAALVYTVKNIRYLAEFDQTDGALLIMPEVAYLLVDSRYSEAARNEAKNVEVVEFTNLSNTISELVKKHGTEAVYLEAEGISYALAGRMQKLFGEIGVNPVIDNSLDDVIRALRIIKSPDEIKKMEASQAITDAAFEYILPKIKEGVTEREIALDIEFFMRKQGAENVAFQLIVVSGKNTSLPHGVPSDKKFEKGDFITMDTGAILDGYHSDMTRTVALGYVNEEQKDIYNTVLKAHLAAMEVIKPGIKCSSVDKVARDIIDAKYPGTFGHGLGHGVGFEIHEWPRFSRLDDTITEAGMIITDEPGIYLPGKYGVRIEDMVLVTEDGYRSLTKSPKELIIL